MNSKATVIQVGANDGKINDPIYKLMRDFCAHTKILLIEPQDDVIPHLRENYSFHGDATIWKGAIGPTSSICLYRLKPEYHNCFIRRYLEDSPPYRVPTGFTSASYDHVLQHVVGNLPAGIDPAKAIECITRQSASLKALLATVGWTTNDLDILQIDTEGLDDVAMYASDLDVLKPRVINFEYNHMSSARIHHLRRWLHSLGYSIHRYNGSDALALNAERLLSIGIQISFRKGLEKH